MESLPEGILITNLMNNQEEKTNEKNPAYDTPTKPSEKDKETWLAIVKKASLLFLDLKN